jgi:hypothetical protein
MPANPSIDHKRIEALLSKVKAEQAELVRTSETKRVSANRIKPLCALSFRKYYEHGIEAGNR